MYWPRGGTSPEAAGGAARRSQCTNRLSHAVKCPGHPLLERGRHRQRAGHRCAHRRCPGGRTYRDFQGVAVSLILAERATLYTQHHQFRPIAHAAM
jgi:hypothetical protein